jgi:hypothetical protein
MQVRALCLDCFETAYSIGMHRTCGGEKWRLVVAEVTRMARQDKDLALRMRAQKICETHGCQDGATPMES